MTIFILIVLVLMNGVGWGSSPVGNFRYGFSVLGILCLIALMALVFGLVPAGR